MNLIELFNLFGTIAVKNDEANRAIDETTNKAETSGGKFQGAMSKIGGAAVKIAKVGAVAVGAAATGIAAVTKQAVANYAEYEQLVGGVETLFKDSSKKVVEYANNAYKTAGMSANEYMDTVTSFSASLLQSLDGDTAAAADKANLAITDMSDNANKMGTSMEMIQNAYQGFAKQNYTMLDNLKLGYGGTQAEMQRLLADAEKLSGQKFDMSSYADIVDAIHIVQTEMGITGTTSKEAASTIQGSISTMKAAWVNLTTGMANPTQNFEKLMQNMVDSVVTVFNNLAPRIVETIPMAVEGISQMISGLIPQIVPLMQQLIPALLQGATQIISVLYNALTTGLTTGLPQLMQKGAELITKIGEGLKTGIPNIISSALNIILNLSTILRENAPALIQSGLDMIVNIAKGLMNSLPTLISTVPTIVSNIANIINDNAPKLLVTAGKLILTLATGLVKAIPSLVQNIPKIIKAVVDVFLAFQWMNLGKSIITKLKNGFVGENPAVLNAAKKIFNTIVNVIKALPSKLFNIAKQAVSKLVSILKHTASVKSAASAIKNEIVYALAKLPAKMLEIGSNLVKGLWNGISNAKNWVLSKIKGFGSSILDGLKDFFGIHSPSKVMEEQVGKNLALGLVAGLEKEKKTVLQASKKNLGKTVADGLVSGIENAKANAKKKSSELSNLIIKEAKKRLDKGKTYNKMNLADEVEYWDAVRKQCKKGTAAKLEADKQYQKAKKALVKEQKNLEADLVTSAEKRLDKYKTYNNMSLQQEVNYWNEIRKAARQGTEARLEADKRYFEAKKSLNEQLKAAEDNYLAKVEEVQQKVVDRTQAILQQFNLFEEFKTTIDEENPITGDGLINNLQTQVDALTQWDEQMETLKGKLGESELFKAVREMGISSMEQVKAINSMTEEQLKKYEELYNKRAEQAKAQAEDELSAENTAELTEAYKTWEEQVASLGGKIKTTNKETVSNVGSTMTKVKTKVNTGIKAVQTVMSKGIKVATSITSTGFGNVVSTIEGKMSSAVSTVKSAVSTMLAELAKVDAAKETTTTTTQKTTTKVEKHAAGGILTEPTIFAYSPNSGTYHLGGEAGDEAVAPIDVLMGYVRTAVASENAEQVSLLARMVALLEAILGKDTSVYLNSKEISKAVNKDLGVIF